MHRIRLLFVTAILVSCGGDAPRASLGEACTDRADCADGLTCHEGTCEAPCIDDGDCKGEGETCGPDGICASSATATCGDGLVADSEACDDGAQAPGDGCDGDCELETGWSCDGEPSVCETTCGDGIQAGDEECDGGLGCEDDCTLSPSFALRLDAGLLTGTAAYGGREFVPALPYVVGTAADVDEESREISNTLYDDLYRSQHWPASGDLTLAIPVPNGDYTLYLHNTETTSAAVGFRVLSVDVEGVRAISDWDLYLDAGEVLDRAVRRRVDVTVSDGQLDIVLVRQANPPKICGIEILSPGEAPLPLEDDEPECEGDGDCDPDFVGDAYCSAGDVYEDHHDWSCVAGVCVDDVTPTLAEDCTGGDTCSAGACVPAATSTQEFLPDQTFVIPENAEVGDAVGMKRVAPNYEPSGAISFSVTGGTGQSLFAIDAASGLIEVSATTGLADGPSSYSLTVTATDSLNNDTATVTIEVLDVDGGEVHFIDPTHGGAQNGTRAEPFTAWSQVTWSAGHAYLQRRGTTFVSAGTIQPGADAVLLGAFGAGARPVIDKDHTEDYSVLVSSRSDVVVRDLHLTAANRSSVGLIYAVSSADVTWDNLEVEGEDDDEYNLTRVLNVENVRILNSDVHHARDDGLYAQDCSIELAYNHIWEVNRNWFVDPDPVVSSGDCAQVVNTILVGYEGHPGAWLHHNLCDRSTVGGKHGLIVGGTQTDPSRLVIEHNRVLGAAAMYGDNTQNGITVHDHPEAIIRYNVVKDFTRAIFFDVGGNEDVVVAYNQLIRTYLWAIQWVNAGAGSQVHNNLFYDFGKGTSDIRSAMRTGWSLTMYNNIFYNPDAGEVIFSASGTVTADHNIFYPDAGGFTPGANSQIGDPGFVDAGSDDFHLSSGSSIAVDAGTDLGYTVDLEGTAIAGAPDVGPLEWSP